jgi:hypothetical protein
MNSEVFAAVHEFGCGTFRTWRDVFLESVMRCKADIGHLWCPNLLSAVAENA